MIGKGKSIKHTFNGINYAERKLKAERLDSHLIVGQNATEIANEFQLFQRLNGHCENNTISFVISPSPEDILTNEQLKAITRMFLREMQINEDYQWVSYVHKDRKHAHIHLYVNRISLTGKAYKDNYIGFRSQDAAEKVGRKLKLICAKDVQKQNIKNNQENSLDILAIHKGVINKNPVNIDEYIDLMEKNDVKIHKAYASKNGNKVLQGLRFEKDNKNLKGSEIHKSMSLLNILKSIENERTASQHQYHSGNIDTGANEARKTDRKNSKSIK